MRKKVKTVLSGLVCLCLFLGAAEMLSTAAGSWLVGLHYAADSSGIPVCAGTGLLLLAAALWLSRRWFAPEYRWPVLAAGLALAGFTGRMAGVVFALLCMLDGGQSDRLLAAAWGTAAALWVGWTAAWYWFCSRRKRL